MFVSEVDTSEITSEVHLSFLMWIQKMLPVRYIFWFLTWIQQTRNHGVFLCVCVLFVSDLDTTDQLPWGLFVVAVLNTTDVYQMRYIFY